MTLIPGSRLAPTAANAARFLFVWEHCGFLGTIVQAGHLYSDVGHTFGAEAQAFKN
jgi:hypothetical protein